MPVRENRSYFFQTGASDRFNATDIPTEDTFRKLLNSSGFISELEDRAQEGSQGFVRVVSDFNAKSLIEPDQNWMYVPRVHQITSVSQTQQTIGTLTDFLVLATKLSVVTTRSDYQVSLSPSFISYLTTEFATVSGAANAAQSTANSAQATANSAQATANAAQATANVASADATAAQSTANQATVDAAAAQSTADTAITNAFNAQATANSNTTAIADGSFIGEMKFYGSATPPTAKWLLCDGAAISRTTYAGLFSLVGTTYGIGDGSTTFNIPDAGTRALMGYKAATSGFLNGNTGGANSFTLTADQLPAHVHTLGSTVADINGAVGASTVNVAGGDDGAVQGSIGNGTNTGNNISAGDPVDNRPNYIAIPVIIRALA